MMIDTALATPVALKPKKKPFNPADPATGVPVPGEFLGADQDPSEIPLGGAGAAPWESPASPTKTAAAPAKTATAAAPAAAPVLQEVPTAPTAIPDGSGGAIPVPPLPTAPVATQPVAGGILTENADNFTAPSTAAPWESAMPAPVTVDAGGAPVTEPDTFTAEQNLINRQVGPDASRRALDLQAAQDAALGKITSGPNRFDLAKEQYDDFTAGAESDYRRARIDETNRAAEGGYLGSGRLSNAYGDVEERRHLADLSARNAFLRPALEGTIQDNLNNLGATRSVANDAYDQDAAGRDEVRGERDYQRNLAEQAIARRIQQQAAEAGMTQQEFENAMRQYQLGNQNNPTGTYENAATNASQEASGAGDDVAALLRAYAARRAAGG